MYRQTLPEMHARWSRVLCFAGLACAACGGEADNADLPAVSLSSPFVRFGSVAVGESATETITVYNVGSAPLELALSPGVPALPETFSYSVAPATVPSGGSGLVTLAYVPTRFGAEAGRVLLETNAPRREVIVLEVEGSGVGAALTTSSTVVDFGTVLVGQTVDVRVRLQNQLSTPLSLSLEGISGVELCTTAASLEPFCGVLSGTGQLPPGASTDLVVRFQPIEAGTAVGTLRVTGCADPGCTIALSLHAAAVESALSCTPGSISFDAIGAGQDATDTVRCTNLFDTPLTVEGWSLEASSTSAFSVSPSMPTLVAPGDTFAIEIDFAPLSVGYFGGGLVVRSAAFPGGEHRIPLSGAAAGAIIRLEPSELDFGEIRAGTPSYMRLDLRNAGFEDLAVSWIEADVFGTGVFTLANPDGSAASSQFVVAPGDRRWVWVRALASDPGSARSSLYLGSNGDVPTMRVPLLAQVLP